MEIKPINTVIITEDTKSGKELFRHIKTELLDKTYTIIGTGGNTNFLDTVKSLSDKRVIRETTVVFLAIDNIALIPQNFPRDTTKKGKENLRTLLNDIQDCRSYIEDKVHGKYVRSEYMSIEECIGSYKRMPEVTKTDKPKRYNGYEQDVLDTFTALSQDDLEIFYGEEQPPADFYIQIFGLPMQRWHKSCESVLSTLLNIQTKKNTSAYFEINKNSIGHCWLLDCSAVRGTEKPNCANCAIMHNYLLKHLNTAKTKLRDLVRGSRLIHIFHRIKEGQDELLMRQINRNKQ